MPQGAFHYCFSGREEMLREVAGRLIDCMVGATTALPPWAGSLEETVAATVLAYWCSLEQKIELRVVLYEVTVAALRGHPTGELARYQYQRYQAVTQAALREMERAFDLVWDQPIDILARQISAVLDGTALQYVVDRDPEAARATLLAYAADLAGHAKVHQAT